MPVIETACQTGAVPRLRAVPGPASGTVTTGRAGSAEPFTAMLAARVPWPSTCAASTAQACSCVLVACGVSSAPGSVVIIALRRSGSRSDSRSSAAVASASRGAEP